MGLTGSRDLDWPDLYARFKSNPEDEAAYEALRSALTRWARRDFIVQVDLEDVVAETCSAVVLGIERAYGPTTFEGFVRGHYFNYRRRAFQRIQRLTAEIEAQREGSELVEAPVDELAPDERDLLERCLGELESRQRKAVRMRHLSGYQYTEIAHELGCSTANARKLVERGMSNLRACAERIWPLGRQSPP
jgi:RNA polymerase sigma factor (sigma-70 family)